MKIFLVSQDVVTGYDTYDSMVVIAEDEVAASRMHPNSSHTYNEKFDEFGIQTFNGDWRFDGGYGGCWARYPKQVTVVPIGVAEPKAEPQVVCASFNAG